MRDEIPGDATTCDDMPGKGGRGLRFLRGEIVTIGTPPRQKIPKWRKCLTNPPPMLQSGMGSPVSYDLQGQGGGQVITSASGAVSGVFRWIQVVTDTVLSAVTAPNLTNASALQSITIPAGVGLGGRFTGITVTSGVIIAYRD